MGDVNDLAAVPVLTHPLVTLVPLAPEHADDLEAAAAADGLHERAWYTSVPGPGEVPAEIDRRLALHEQGRMAPWAILVGGTAVGMTTFMHLEPETPRLEIGSTWLAAAHQGTGVNAAMKLLLLERAFDALGCVAIELRTHAHNHQSRAAIARLGAHQDGILRSHLHHRGLLRDTVVFSILAGEWPMVRRGLEARLARPRG